MSRRRQLPDPDGFNAIVGVNGRIQARGLREQGGPYDLLGLALDRWLRAARAAYAAADFESVQHHLGKVRAVYAELSLEMTRDDFGPWIS